MNQMDPVHNSLNHFCVAGINYRESDIHTRSQFALSPEHTRLLLKDALLQNFKSCIALSTCNRTEIYGLSHRPHQLIEILCRHTSGTENDFLNHGYLLKGLAAVEHLFKVAGGLDSQILGDYEILAQLKQSVKISKENNCLNSFMERIITYSFQASKEIKTATKISAGTVSVSYAAIELIKERVNNADNKKILLVGTGKFGNLIGKNLKYYLPGLSLFIANRTNEKAMELSGRLGASFVPYHHLADAANDADIIIVSSSSDEYTVLPAFFKNKKPRLLLDLSVPENVDPEVRNIKGISLLNVDEISVILNKTKLQREAEIPKAVLVINKTIHELITWDNKKTISPWLRKVKTQLYELDNSFVSKPTCEQQIQKAINSLAVQLQEKNNRGCQCISTLNNYLHLN